MIIILFFIVLFFQFVQIPCPVFSEELRVRIFTNRASVDVSSSETIYITNKKTGENIACLPGNMTYLLKPENSGIKMVTPDEGAGPSTVFFPSEITIRPDTTTGKMLVNNREYRGAFLIKRAGAEKISSLASLDVINILDIEDYIRGTIKYEISPLWPQEAIKAHIAAARTYALFQMKNKKNGDFDVESTVISQVYGGCSGEDTLADMLVQNTRGEYIDYGGNITEGFYHACCGGYTEDISDVWGIRRPYLQGIRCPFCKESPHYYWERKFTFSQIQTALRKFGIDLSEIRGISVDKRRDTGRIVNLEIRHAQGKLDIRGIDFRRFLGYNDLPSTLFTINHRGKGELIFTGRGWGHGVGMCQWGARGMALLGYNYREILRYYYPGIEIKTLQ